ncbi:MAG TPA: hypothetical protein VME40_15075 [Caulobacteraceae bacterium]|nr:hypothetical protein [Caulobacteraceae bacterium]
MDLIDRYLAAVGVLLPQAQKADIIAELRDVLLNRREEKEATLGRPLTRSENEALLKDFGNPLTVAGRYGRQQYLIGPELYPIYVFSLRIVLAAVVVSAVITGVVQGVFDPANAANAVLAAFNIVWTGGFTALGVVTAIFAGLQRTSAGARILERWSPNDLPRLPRRRRRGWPDFVAAIVVNVIFLLWWSHLINFWQPLILAGPGQSLHIGLAPVWRELYWPVFALALGVIAINGARLAGLAHGRLVHGLDMALQIATLGVAGYALRAGQWAVVTGRGLDAAALRQVQYGVDVGLMVTLIVVIVVATVTLGYDAWRLYRPAPAAA